MIIKTPVAYRVAVISAICLLSCLRWPASVRACDPNPDPQGLAGPHVVFINNCTAGTSIFASNANTREQAMNPSTPLRDPFGLRVSDTDSKLKGATATDPIGDTVYIRGGTYEMPLISVWNRVVFMNEHNIKIKPYPGERVTIRASSFLPGGNPPNTYCYPIPAQGLCLGIEIFQFWNSDDITVEGINFVGNTTETILVAGQNVTGMVSQPYMLRFWQCNRLTLRDLEIRDFSSIADIGLGQRYLLDPSYMHTEYMRRGLTVSYSTGLEMDRVRISCSPDNPGVVDQSTAPWDIVGFITESLIGDAAHPVRIHHSSFGNCAGNAVELSTVSLPQRNILFENNLLDNWKNGVQVGGSGLSEDVTLRNNRITYNRYAMTALGTHGYGIKLTNSNHCSIINNIIYNGGMDGIGIQVIAGPVGYTSYLGVNDTTIAHNTLYRAGAQAISLVNDPNPDGSLHENGLTQSRVVNNLVYEINPGSAQSANLNNPKRELYLQFVHFEENLGYGNTFMNNLFVPARSDGKAIGSADFGYWLLNGGGTGSWQCYNDPTISGCAWTSCAPIAGCEAPSRYKYNAAGFNSLFPYVQNNLDATAASPMFVDADNIDFRLVSASPAVNRALCLPEVPTDIDGVIRSKGGGCSIGAYEFDPPIPGDLNCDDLVNLTDVSVLVLALTNPSLYAQTYTCIQNADFNQDTMVDGRDVRGFVDLLTP